MATSEIPDEVKSLGSLTKVIEGKTKVVYQIESEPNRVVLYSKDRITAGDGAKSHALEGKAAISTSTTVAISEILTAAGVRSHFVRGHGPRSFVAEKCDMIPIEWVTRRVATGSFIRRNKGVPEGYKFYPALVEYFYKDDANHDPQWSYEQLATAGMKHGGVTLVARHIDALTRATRLVFEILERSWATQDCALIDMKIEFGVNAAGELVLADIIDSDSWRLWPKGDKRLMVDKQVYRNMSEVTAEGLQQVKLNFQWVADKIPAMLRRPESVVLIVMGSPSDRAHCESIAAHCAKLGLRAELRVSSAHKSTRETLRLVSPYEGRRCVVVAVAGRSNGLGPVLAGNLCLPVINCPPGADKGDDVWSSLRLPSGLGCSTVVYPEAAALAAADILAIDDHILWAKLKVKQLKTIDDLELADHTIQESSSQ